MLNRERALENSPGKTLTHVCKVRCTHLVEVYSLHTANRDAFLTVVTAHKMPSGHGAVFTYIFCSFRVQVP